MSTRCEITFENNSNKVYYGGQLIVGKVHLTLVKDKILKGKKHLYFDYLFIFIYSLCNVFFMCISFKGIFIDVTGVAECKWNEHIKTQRITYRGNEVYLNVRSVLVGCDNEGS